jgi:hypothetical protein
MRARIWGSDVAPFFVPNAFQARLTGSRDEWGKESAADDGAPRCVQLEEEELPWPERLELPAAAGLPEVDLVQLGFGSELPEPVPVRYPDPDPHVKLFPCSSASLVRALG